MLFFVHLTASFLSCKNPYGDSVDWWAMFKMPTISRDPNPAHAKGLGYFYHDDASPLAEAPGDVNSTTYNPLYHTLSPIYSGDCYIGYVLVNDQPPPETYNSPSSYAHMKGALLFDEDNAVYLTSSVPRFPPDPLERGFIYPDTGNTYGQAFQCMTFDHTQVDIISEQLLIARPWIYASEFPAYAQSLFPKLYRVVNKDQNKANTSNIVTVRTLAGKELKLFSKSASWGQEFYHDLIAPDLQEDTYSETWRLGTGTLASDCSGSFSSYNIREVKFVDVQWTTTKDHSKWAVAGDWVCIGDINRQNGQKSRGGTTFCNRNSTWAEMIKNTIVWFDDCTADDPATEEPEEEGE